MFIQQKYNVFDIKWSGDITYGDVHHQAEVDYSYYNFIEADTEKLFKWFNDFEKECLNVISKSLVQPAYDYALKCSHTFNLLDARGAISVTERTHYIHRVRELARKCANAWVEQREKLGYPLLKKNSQRSEQ